MRTPFSIGSTWMSLALLLIALFTTRSTRSMIGAASLRSFSAGDRLEHFVFDAPRQRRLAGRRLGAGAPAACARGRAVTAQLAAALRRGAHQRLVGIAGLNRVDDVAARRDDLLDAIAGLELEVLDQAEEQRVGHRDRQQVLFEADGDADALERDFLGNQDDRGRIGRVLGEVDVRKPELERQRLRDLFFGREVHAHEDDAEALAGALVLGQRGLEIVFSDEARLNQALTDLLAQRRASGSDK